MFGIERRAQSPASAASRICSKMKTSLITDTRPGYWYAGKAARLADPIFEIRNSVERHPTFLRHVTDIQLVRRVEELLKARDAVWTLLAKWLNPEICWQSTSCFFEAAKSSCLPKASPAFFCGPPRPKAAAVPRDARAVPA